MRTRQADRGRGAGFTLIELSIVIVIIGILVAFILSVGGQGVRNAEIRATQSLIAKLDTGLEDLMQQIVNNRVDPNSAHAFLGAIPNYQTDSSGNALPMITSAARAQTIANVDNVRALIPDVWFYQPHVADYPINCAGVPYDPAGTYGSSAYSSPYAPFALPMGNQISPKFFPAQLTGSVGVGDGGLSAPTGIFGANFGVRAGLTKNLGYLATGYDGQDNNNNGLVDELTEGIGGNSALQAQIAAQLARHTHATARSEMLYAVLIEGIGPYGAVLSRDDFTSQEVQDTDGDGLPEFVDAWKQPIQFYLWPISYTSDIQKGFSHYANSAEPREQAPLDADQDLMAPAWWADSTSSSYPPPPYLGAKVFSSLFYPLFEVVPSSGTATPGGSTVWDRQYLYPTRRAYYTKPLICSSGPDLNLGFYQLDDAFIKTYGASPGSASNPFQGYLNPNNTWSPGESSALPLAISGQLSINPNHVDPRISGDSAYYTYGDDDLTNQTLLKPGGGIQ